MAKKSKKKHKKHRHSLCPPLKPGWYEFLIIILIIVLVWFVPNLLAKIGITIAALIILLAYILRSYLLSRD
jgi:uncharacterized membrane protein